MPAKGEQVAIEIVTAIAAAARAAVREGEEDEEERQKTKAQDAGLRYFKICEVTGGEVRMAQRMMFVSGSATDSVLSMPRLVSFTSLCVNFVSPLSLDMVSYLWSLR